MLFYALHYTLQNEYKRLKIGVVYKYAVERTRKSYKIKKKENG